MSSGYLPNVAVLLAAYNGVEWLPAQVKTILDQRDVSMTLFVSVDRSADGTEQWFDELAARDSRVKVLPHGCRFGGAARNFFRLINEVDLSGYDYISLSDQDDLWLEDKLSKAVNILQHSSYEGYSSNVTAFWSDGRRELVHKAQPQKPWDYLFEAAGPGCSYVLKGSLVQLIRERLAANPKAAEQVYLHDWFFYAVARANNRDWYIDPEPTMLYRQHDSNQFGVNSGLKALLGRLRQFTDGFWLEQGALIASVVGLSKNGFVRSWNKLNPSGLFRLAASARMCRRRPRDQVFFFFLCLILAVKRSVTRA